jgi:hypothetical protein
MNYEAKQVNHLKDDASNSSFPVISRTVSICPWSLGDSLPLPISRTVSNFPWSEETIIENRTLANGKTNCNENKDAKYDYVTEKKNQEEEFILNVIREFMQKKGEKYNEDAVKKLLKI